MRRSAIITLYYIIRSGSVNNLRTTRASWSGTIELHMTLMELEGDVRESDAKKQPPLCGAGPRRVAMPGRPVT